MKKDSRITFLLVRHYNDYFVYSPNTYGIESWGSNTQYSIVKKRKFWYYKKWVGGASENVYLKLNVVLETTSIQSIINVCKIICPRQLRDIVYELQCITDTFSTYLNFYSKGKKQ